LYSFLKINCAIANLVVIIIYVPASKTNSETAVGSRRCALSCASVTFQLFSKTEKKTV